VHRAGFSGEKPLAGCVGRLNERISLLRLERAISAVGEPRFRLDCSGLIKPG